MRRLSLIVLLAVLIAPTTSQAGGSNVSVAVTPQNVWVATGIDVVELDARSGRVERRYLARYRFTLSLGLSRNELWVSSVDNGFTAGAVTRIPLTRGPIQHPLVRPTQPVLSLAVGARTTWALIGPWTSTKLAAISHGTEHVTLKPIRDVSGIAADDTGQTPGLYALTPTGHLIRLATDGSTLWSSGTVRIEGPPLVALDSVWLESRGVLYRLATTGRTQAAIPLHSDGAYLASGGGRVWVASLHHHGGALTYELLEVDPRRERVVKRAALAGPVGAIAYGAGTLWIGQAGISVSLLRVDPATLESRTFATGLDNNLVPIQRRRAG
jgi:hypothetical protein